MKTTFTKWIFSISTFMFTITLNAQSLVAYYPFSGSTSDYSGNNYNGVNINATLTTDRFGIADKAYHFGGNAVITIPSGGLQTNNYTYSVWAKVTTMPGNGIGAALLSIGNSSALGDQNVFLGNQYSTPVLTGLAAGSYTNPSVYPLPPSTVKTGILPQLNQWYHIVSVRDTVRGKLFLFIDGIKVSQDSLKVLKAGYATPCIATIGARSPGNTQYYTGDLDDIRIFNYALTDAEVLSLYNSDKTATTGLSDSYNTIEYPVNVFPNPSNGVVNISVKGVEGEMMIHNIAGSIVRRISNFTGETEVASLDPGVYFCSIISETGQLARTKFVIAK